MGDRQADRSSASSADASVVDRQLGDWFAQLAPSSCSAAGSRKTSSATAKSSSTPPSQTGGGPDVSVARSLGEIAGELAGFRSAASPGLLLSISKQAMACEFEVLLNQHEYPQGAELASQALEQIEEFEDLLSVYRPKSELSTLNRFGHQNPITVSPDTLALLRLGASVSTWTQGAFDMTSGQLSELWGFGRKKGVIPNANQIQETLELIGAEHVEIEPAESSVRIKKQGVQLNPGGIGKGYALDRSAEQLRREGIANFMMHGGLSSITASGHRQGSEDGWAVALKHPWRWEEELGTIRLHDRSLGTSGSGKQFFHFGGERYSHIIDPRSGWPAQGMMSTTVICPSAAVADSLATAFFVMGAEQAADFCEQHQQIAAILVYQDPKSGRQRIRTCNVDAEDWSPANN